MRNKDTLLQEADEYVNSIYEFGRNSNCMYTQVQVRQAYIDGKKSMQKENAELKKDIEARKFAMEMSGKVEKQLRQEITGLNNQIEKMKCCGNCNSLFCNAEDKLNCGYNYDNWSLRT